MPLFGKPSDPLREKERALRRKLTQVESDLRRMASTPPVRTVKSKKSARSPRSLSAPPAPGLAVPRDGVMAGSHYNEQGLRKFDLVGQLRRLGQLLPGPTAYNRQMVRMLAAGSIDGLPVLRRERKRALFRFLFLFGLLLSILWGIGYSYFHER